MQSPKEYDMQQHYKIKLIALVFLTLTSSFASAARGPIDVLGLVPNKSLKADILSKGHFDSNLHWITFGNYDLQCSYEFILEKLSRFSCYRENNPFTAWFDNRDQVKNEYENLVAAYTEKFNYLQRIPLKGNDWHGASWTDNFGNKLTVVYLESGFPIKREDRIELDLYSFEYLSKQSDINNNKELERKRRY